MKVLIKNPGETPILGAEIANTLESLQQHVGGNIETVRLCKDLTIICNEEGLLRGLPYNCTICGADFVGPIIICGVDGDEFCSVPVDDWRTMEALLPQLWEV